MEIAEKWYKERVAGCVTFLCNYNTGTLRKLCFHFLSNRMGYGCSDSFPFDFKPNGIQFDSKSKRKMSPQPYPIRFERKWKYSFFSASERRVPLGNISRPIKAPLKPRDTTECCHVRGGGLR